MEKLWNALFPLAEKQLRRFGVFSPFAAAMRLDGTMVRVPENSMRDCQTDVVRVGALAELLEQTGSCQQDSSVLYLLQNNSQPAR
jgi:uncharacterized protein YjeT (DUF2065 family)